MMVSSHAIEGWTSYLDDVCSEWVVANLTTISLHSALVAGRRPPARILKIFCSQNFWHYSNKIFSVTVLVLIRPCTILKEYINNSSGQTINHNTWTVI